MGPKHSSVVLSMFSKRPAVIFIYKSLSIKSIFNPFKLVDDIDPYSVANRVT